MLNTIIILALINSTLLLCAYKWKWLEWYSMIRPIYLPKADCYLCLGFWMALIEAVIPYGIMAIPIALASACLTNFFTNNALIHEINKKRGT